MEENKAIYEFHSVLEYLYYFKNLNTDNGDYLKEVDFAPVGITSINKKLYAFNDKDVPNPKKPIKIYSLDDGTIISITFYRRYMDDLVTKYSFEAKRAFDFIHGFETVLYKELKKKASIKKAEVTELKSNNDNINDYDSNEKAHITPLRR